MDGKVETAGILFGRGVLTRAQLAGELGLTEETVALMEADGLPVLGLGRKVRLYDIEEVLAFMRKQRKRRVS